MMVLVTGGTGLVGARITADLVGNGHRVRMLARRPEQVPVSLAPYDVDVRDVVPGQNGTGALVFDTLQRATGRRLPHVDLPASVLLPGVRALHL